MVSCALCLPATFTRQMGRVGADSNNSVNFSISFRTRARMSRTRRSPTPTWTAPLSSYLPVTTRTRYQTFSQNNLSREGLSNRRVREKDKKSAEKLFVQKLCIESGQWRFAIDRYRCVSQFIHLTSHAIA